MLLLQTFNKTPRHTGTVREGQSAEGLSEALGVSSPQRSARASGRTCAGWSPHLGPFLVSGHTLSHLSAPLAHCHTACPTGVCFLPNSSRSERKNTVLYLWLSFSSFHPPTSTVNQCFPGASEKSFLSIFLFIKKQELITDTI